MKEIHEIQARIYEEQKCMTEKEKLEALHNEAKEQEKELILNSRQMLTARLM
jgi:hypothetical protein